MKNNEGLVIAVDFDGTCVTHDYPRVGSDIGSVPVLKELVAKGHKLILWTMRSDNNNFPGANGTVVNTGLTDAINWFKENDIPLYAAQRNPTQDTWTQSPKCYAQVYLDDAAMGCPLIIDLSVSDRPFVNWQKMRHLLVLRGILD